MQLWLHPQLFGQDFDHYHPLQSIGDIPEELRTASSQKFARELAQLGDSAKGKAGRAREAFLLQSNFAIDDLLLSGRVIFNDPVSVFVNNVKNRILRDEPELQKSVRTYIVKSPVVNAFATNSGIVLVNMGLLAHLRTEAELAFVLCHEIQHYIHKHPINNYVNADKLRNNAKLLGLNSADEYIAARTRYSRSLEVTADELGFELFKRSGYSLTAAEGVFDMLDRADRPFDELPWDPSAWEWDYLRFPAEFEKWPLDTLKANEDENDTLSTHPSTRKRRAAIAAKVAAEGEDNGEVFQIGAEQFLQMRKLCRFELCEQFLSRHAYEDAIYNSYLLMQEEPESRYLKKIVAQSLYGMCTYRNSRKFSEVHIDAADRPGEIQQLLYFNESLDKEAFAIVAVHQIWKTYLADPEDKELEAIAMDILAQLFKNQYDATQWLVWDKPKEMPDIVAKVIAGQQEALKRRNAPEIKEEDDQPEEKTAETKKEDPNDYLQWALTDLFQQPKFAEAWQQNASKAKEPAKDVVYQSARSRSRQAKKERLKGAHLGIDKIVLVQPIYKHVDLRDRIPVQYLASETALEQYKETLAEMAKRNEVQFQILENRNLDANEVQAFNDASKMLQWLSEHVENADEEVDLVNFRQDEANELIQRYGTKYFAWNGVISSVERQSFYRKMLLITMSIMIMPTIPLAIVLASLPIKKAMFVTLVFDVEKSEVIMEDFRQVRGKDSRAMVRSIVYDTFLQIKSKPKK